MKTIHLWPEGLTDVGDWVELGVTLELPGGDCQRLWYRTPAHYGERLTHHCDPFVVATIMLAMRQRAEIRIHGEVSFTLLRNLEEFQSIWFNWYPSVYRIVDLWAEKELKHSATHTVQRTISAFSGGVDSCFTAWRHRQGRCGRLQQPLQTGLMVHGFDIPLTATDGFAGAALRAQKMLVSLGLEFLPVATNFREVFTQNWEEIFATAIASALLLFQRYYSVGLIPASHPYRAREFIYGSNPVSDHLLSTQTCTLIHDGAGVDRVTKIRELSQWPEALQHLRVCWEGAYPERNCGVCEKCIRNILSFRVVGIQAPACFDHHVTDAEILSLNVKGAALSAYQNLLNSAKSENISSSWVKALTQAIQRNQRQAALQTLLPSIAYQFFRAIKFYAFYLLRYF
jgi:hypothetical protein